jgi:hypothetical protein
MISRHTGRNATGAFFAAALCVSPIAVLAQTAAPSPTPAQTQTTTPAQSAGDKVALARAEARIKELHAKLHITAAEEPQWEAFTAVMRENAQHTEETAAQRGDPSTMTALDEMRGYTAMAAAHAADMQKMLPAFEALYTSLSPEQKKLADELFREREGRRRR